MPLSATLPTNVERALALAHAPRYRLAATPSEGRSAWRVAIHAGRMGPLVASLRSIKARRAVDSARLDGLVQIGTGYLVEASQPTVTFEDMTIRQLAHYPYAEWNALPDGHVRRRVEIQRRAYERASACCATSTWARNSIVDDYGIPSEKAHAVGVGTNLAAERFARDWSRPRFLFVGREWERKNGPRVVRAFARLRAEHPDAELHLVGSHPRIDEPGVVGHGVLRLDEPHDRARLRSLFARSTCFVMPSMFEPSAIAYVEAASAGIPSIGTRNGGSSDLIGDGGVVVDPSDDNAVLAAVRLLSDPANARGLGERAWRRAPLFTWEAVAQRLLLTIGANTREVQFVEPPRTPEVTGATLTLPAD